MILHRVVFAASVAVLVAACNKEEAPSKPAAAKPAAVQQAAPAAKAAVTSASAVPKQTAIVAAKIGDPAPDFTLTDLDGNAVTLSSFKGKTVVLEWFNPGCPFVNLSHTKGSLVDTAARHTKEGVVWLAINSAGPGKEGYGVDENRAGKERFKLTHPILLDPDGKVGHAYGAEHTPHLFVIDPQGVLAYHGAVDNSPDAEGQSPAGGKLINYVDAALSDIAAKRPVATPATEAYGCHVKYSDS